MALSTAAVRINLDFIKMPPLFTVHFSWTLDTYLFYLYIHPFDKRSTPLTSAVHAPYG